LCCSPLERTAAEGGHQRVDRQGIDEQRNADDARNVPARGEAQAVPEDAEPDEEERLHDEDRHRIDCGPIDRGVAVPEERPGNDTPCRCQHTR
jgi:hypothetical protein